MNPAQIQHLAEVLACEPEELNIVHVNFTFAAKAVEACKQIKDLSNQHWCQNIAGVLPAHIAAAWVAEMIMTCNEYITTLIPVSVPKHAEDGQERGFEFSHWEVF